MPAKDSSSPTKAARFPIQPPAKTTTFYSVLPLSMPGREKAMHKTWTAS